MVLLRQTFLFVLAVVAFIVLSACKLVFPDTSGAAALSRRDAIEIHCGGIWEKEFLERLATSPKTVPSAPDTFAVGLNDGELLYKTEIRDGKAWVSEIILPASDNVPAELRAYAASFKTKLTPKTQVSASKAVTIATVFVKLDKTGNVFVDGVEKTHDGLVEEFLKLGSFDESAQSEVIILIDPEASVEVLSKIINAAENSGIKKLFVRSIKDAR